MRRAYSIETGEVRIENESRRHFLQRAAGLTLAVYLPAAGAAAGRGLAGGKIAGGAKFEANAFVHIGADDSVTVFAKHLEMGQGSYTGLATILAEELDAAWPQVRVEGAPADAKRYNNLFWGPTQGTGGSTAIANSWEQLRKAGASARAMLVGAAARRWNVPAGEISVADGVVMHKGSGKKSTFGQLAKAAGEQPVPAEVTLKDPKDFKLIGKRIPRKDSPDKTTGKAVFTQDIHLPGMLTAAVAHPPLFGAKVKSFDAGKARAVKGVVDVVQIPSGVAVLGHDTWSAKKGRDELVVEWDESAAFKLGSAEIMARYREAAKAPGVVARKEGDADQALTAATRKFEASFEFPYLAHAAMEPMNCVVRLNKDGTCEMWNGEQMHTLDQARVAGLFGLAPEKVSIHSLYAGGGFGRRANKDSDYVLETAQIVKAISGRAPVKLVWLREDDMRAGYYRPMFYHTLQAALDEQGNPIGWKHRLVGQSIMAGSPFEKMTVKDGVDAVSVEGAANLPYQIPNLLVDLHTPTDIGVPVLWWRSVGSTHTAFSTEIFIDELAVAANKDPVHFRLALLGKHPRHAGVLKLAAEQAGWGKPLAPGKAGERRGRGVAVHESFNTFVAEVAEVTVRADGSLTVDRVVVAVDCGVAVNPDVIRAQAEGSVGFALSAVLYNQITLKDGAVEQSNFHDYPQIRMAEMPRVEVHIVPSAANPTGIGEPAVPPLAPAVANAIAAATGKRLRSLPIAPDLLKV
ncbi:MAG: xanthine dehydrogenase family protein molybdopterin-binding subunit [Sterolibacteriaceae bacterium]|uniref:Xanthine dehydrogenase family protein molybdopterin-binding subunit n=1 Tax=Candidatus Methylophosphatis roskildensis TaxID=2899263 RepID=A0A9D7E0P3_9PROT|nr:xanthine dehydrogenase family protein molybdopterin-binding subunit [Candidatus Methylophosphatis roskildensis]MBK7236253.1 xanthine dehydrogenase family protein molybdopterin-binding subunit [Sterolibacteriaceae bacterium]